jgi:hypothetical protein
VVAGRCHSRLVRRTLGTRSCRLPGRCLLLAVLLGGAALLLLLLLLQQQQLGLLLWCTGWCQRRL